MNKDNPTRESVPDEPAEARIVAWVLGEASAFEAAELQRLCRQRPALEEFHQHMLSIHGMLAETQAAGADAGWKLPAAKRRVIEERIGAPLPTAAAVSEASIRRSGRRAFYAIAACLVLTAVMARFLVVFPGMDVSAPTSTIVTYQADAPESAPAAPADEEVQTRPLRLMAPLASPFTVRPAPPEPAQEHARRLPPPPNASMPTPPSPSRSASAIETRNAGVILEAEQQTPAHSSHSSHSSHRDEFDPSAPPAAAGEDSAMRRRQDGRSASDVQPAELRAENSVDSIPQPAIRSNPALTHEHTEKVDQVRRALYLGEGNFNLGKHDAAKAEFENVLRIDPYNSAARRGLERVAAAKSDYYRAAYDHTRAELLMQVEQAWELAVPAESEPVAPTLVDSGLIQPEYPNPLLEELAGSLRGNDLYYTPSADQQPVFPLEDARPVMSGLLADMSLFATEQEPEPAVAKLAEAQLRAEAPPRDTIEPTDTAAELAPLEIPYSTFSLHVSDASFQIARAAIARGGRPDPAQVKPEQFYNAVDYGDPSPVGSERIAGLVEQSAHPVIPNRNLVRIALKTAAAGRSAAQPLRLTLLVDQSGSMSRDDRREAMASAIAQLATLLDDKDLVNVIGFSRTPRLMEEALRGDHAERLGALLGRPPDAGGTNLEEALLLAQQIALRHHDPAAQNRVVLFTDGAVNLGDADPGRLADRVAAMRRQGLALDIAGIGIDGLNDRLLSELARNGNGRYYIMNGADEGDNGFARQLAGAFRPAAEDVKVQVSFNPERVAGYRLIGFEEHRLRPEDFRNDAVDAAELAAEEAGVALYQVNPLPEGRGEIGEVTVRFREAASGEILERSWVIPYHPATPAFDRATPSMQLAGLSMLAAEKLRGGALADAIDFRSFAGPKAEVASHFRDSAEVSAMLGIITALE